MYAAGLTLEKCNHSKQILLLQFMSRVFQRKRYQLLNGNAAFEDGIQVIIIPELRTT